MNERPRRAEHGRPVCSTGDPCLDVIASVYRLALADAQRGDAQAVEWLDVVAPDWREWQQRATMGERRRTAMYNLAT